MLTPANTLGLSGPGFQYVECAFDAGAKRGVVFHRTTFGGVEDYLQLAHDLSRLGGVSHASSL